MARVWRAFALAAYLVGQAGVFFHAEEAFRPCATCEGESPGLRLDCADEDCREPGHHHHRNLHHAGSCATCASAGLGATEQARTIDRVSSLPCVSSEPSLPSGFARVLQRVIRAPPGDSFLLA
jgi:hypothetical protein